MSTKLDIPWASPSIWGNEKKYVNDAIDKLWISGGEYVSKLENQFSELFENPYTLTTSNGTTSLHLIYLALGLKPNDEIIVPGFGFLAASNIALQMGVIPKFADVDKETWCVTADNIYSKITKKTKAIVPIHTYGNVCEMDKIMSLANDYKIPVIEDCAESLFSKKNGKYCGTLGNYSTFSFQATKTITTGEGGLVVSDNEEFFNKMILYRSHGLPVRGSYYHEIPGHNFRLTNLQAAFGVAQFECKDKIIDYRKKIYETYINYLTEIDGITLQKFDDNVDAVVWAIALKINPKIFGVDRDDLIQKLKSKGIETRPGFISSSLLKIYESHKLDVSEDLSNTVISLPSSPSLTEKDINYICSSILSFKKK
jgi:perosamine synthetase